MPMTVKEYRALCQKNEQENYFFDRYFFRKISIYFTIIFIRLKISANQATFLSLLAALSSCYFLMFNSPFMMLMAVFFIFLYHLLDHVDGELARYYTAIGRQKPSIQGQYFDVLIHKYSTNLMLFFLGISVYNLFGYQWVVVLGFAACIGMSAFPNVIASQVMVQKIANDKDIVFNKQAHEILNLLEKKKEQIKKMHEQNVFKKSKKFVSELLFFPGALMMIMLVVTIDIFNPGFILFSVEMNFRLVFLIFVTPIYLLNAVRQSMKWMKKFGNI